MKMDQETNKFLHSRYNPQAEADRYINSLSLNENIRFFILIEPGLGYIIGPLKKKYPSAGIISLHAGEHLQDKPAGNLSPPDSEWRPGTGSSVQDFLENEISDAEAAEIKVLEWRPALAVYGRAYLALVEETINFIKRADANARTTKAFAKRWTKNFFRNIGIVKKVICPEQFSAPIVVAGAGPSLESAIPLIVDGSEKRTAFILASASSVMALETQNLVPDMAISTDGGNWAALHLHECLRGTGPHKNKDGFPIAASMTAALPSQCGAMRILPISDGSLWQGLVLNALEIPFVTLPQRGTVSASAIDLAFGLTKGSVFIAGMDLSNRGIRSHARPYSFDRLFEEQANRLNPVYSQAFKRSSLMEKGGSYAIYAAWFKKQLTTYPRRLFPLGKNNPIFNPLEGGSFESCGGDKTTQFNFKTVTLKHIESPAIKAAGVLEKALLDSGPVSGKLRGELASLLFCGSSDVSSNDLIEAIYLLAGRGKR